LPPANHDHAATASRDQSLGDRFSTRLILMEGGHEHLISFALTPWERTSGDVSYALNPPRDFASDQPARPGMVSTVITFKRLKK
jgi:hypothetical protein